MYSLCYKSLKMSSLLTFMHESGIRTIVVRENEGLVKPPGYDVATVMAAAMGAAMTAVVALAGGWWEERWCAAAVVCMVVVCLSAGTSDGQNLPQEALHL